jgi:dihydrolipoamide dehydrogenase
MTRHIIVIGGGPAGIEAARAAAVAGARVTFIGDEPVGGRAGWHSLLPSKVWLAAADTIGLMAESPALADPVAENIWSDPGGILRHIKAVKDTWNTQQAEELKLLGVNLMAGVASFRLCAYLPTQSPPGWAAHPGASFCQPSGGTARGDSGDWRRSNRL